MGLQSIGAKPIKIGCEWGSDLKGLQSVVVVVVTGGGTPVALGGAP